MFRISLHLLKSWDAQAFYPCRLIKSLLRNGHDFMVNFELGIDNLLWNFNRCTWRCMQVNIGWLRSTWWSNLQYFQGDQIEVSKVKDSVIIQPLIPSGVPTMRSSHTYPTAYWYLMPLGHSSTMNWFIWWWCNIVVKSTPIHGIFFSGVYHWQPVTLSEMAAFLLEMTCRLFSSQLWRTNLSSIVSFTAFCSSIVSTGIIQAWQPMWSLQIVF